MCVYIGYTYVHKKWMVAAEYQSNENFYQCYMSEPATKPKILFTTFFTNQCTKLGGYMNTVSNARDFILLSFLLLKKQSWLCHLPV